jgi:DNA-directed RNA polymerase specialized sigma24 family protein
MQPVLPYACDYQEREFAVWLEDTEPQNLEVQQVLVERYALGVYRLAWGILSEYKSDPVMEEDIRVVVRRNYDLAIDGLAGFQGQESVRSWLFRMTIQAAQEMRRRPACLGQSWFRSHRFQPATRIAPSRPRDSSQEKLWASVHALRFKLKRVAFLRYVHHLTLPEIACVLNNDVSQIHTWLVDVRKELLDGQSPDGEAVHPHGEFCSMMHAFLDGTVDMSVYRSDLRSKCQLETHLENCLVCRDYYEYFSTQVNQIAFSPDGRLATHALSDNTVWLRRTSDGETITRMSGSGSKVLSVTFSPDGNYLASGSADGRVDIWKIESEDGVSWSPKNILALLHTSWIGGLDFSPDGKVLAVASLGSSVCLWRIPSGELIATSLGTTWDPAQNLAFAPDGKSLAVSLSWGGVKIWPFPKNP